MDRGSFARIWRRAGAKLPVFPAAAAPVRSPPADGAPGHDWVSGLPDRAMLFQRLITLIDAADVNGMSVAVLAVVLPPPSDPGEGGRDARAGAVADAVQRVSAAFDGVRHRILAQLDADSLVLAVTGLAPGTAQQLAERIGSRLETTCYAPDGSLVVPRASIGVAERLAGEDAAALVTAAQDAAGVAARLGYGRCCVAARRGRSGGVASPALAPAASEVETIRRVALDTRFDSAVAALRAADGR